MKSEKKTEITKENVQIAAHAAVAAAALKAKVLKYIVYVTLRLLLRKRNVKSTV